MKQPSSKTMVQNTRKTQSNDIRNRQFAYTSYNHVTVDGMQIQKQNTKAIHVSKMTHSTIVYGYKHSFALMAILFSNGFNYFLNLLWSTDSFLFFSTIILKL